MTLNDLPKLCHILLGALLKGERTINSRHIVARVHRDKVKIILMEEGGYGVSIAEWNK